jgi:hypothetical protein
VEFEKDEEITSLREVLRGEEATANELKARIRVLEEALEVGPPAQAESLPRGHTCRGLIVWCGGAASCMRPSWGCRARGSCSPRWRASAGRTWRSSRTPTPRPPRAH